ncbi:MAG: hypothetical protein BVN29_10130 [Nitrospira sp. ST-bin5]|nr:MAG: hypothetical protein BVN29_10130 [Nitrospira sp. ST-bin5]
MQASTFTDATSHWVTLEIVQSSPILMVVIHANGDYMFLDEILWRPTTTQYGTLAGTIMGDKKAVTEDSLKRLRSTLLHTLETDNSDNLQLAQTSNAEPFILWDQPPWDNFKLHPTLDELKARRGLPIKILGTKNELESASFGILNTKTESGHVTIAIRGKKASPVGLRLRAVVGVLAADGTIALDALPSVTEGQVIPVSAKQAAYFWITADLSKYCCGNTELTIVVKELKDGAEYKLPLHLTVANYALPSSKQPHAINWGYTNDKPIWSNPQEALDDLVSHGVNVFVIHPSNIPQPMLSGSWDAKMLEKLLSTAKVFKNRGMLLLYLGWNLDRATNDNRLDWLLDHTGGTDNRRDQALQRWLTMLTKELGSLGFDKSDWALYPVDEPHGNNLQALRGVATLIKRVDPSIQIYANPTSPSNGRTTPADLEPLRPYINIWQPDLAFAAGDGKSFFQTLSKPWWIYSNPSSPAKSASPFNHYRKMAWKAWTLGSSGVGFWSYSDTQGSSAWDDLDGSRPDWAVVYEGQSIISSRRWEAFSEGLEDFRLLQAAFTENPRGLKSELENLRKEIEQFAWTPSSQPTLQKLRLRILTLMAPD